MSKRKDPTADKAIGSVNREWNRMVKLAIRIRESGDIDLEDRESWRFKGIYKRLLNEPVERLRSMAA